MENRHKSFWTFTRLYFFVSLHARNFPTSITRKGSYLLTKRQSKGRKMKKVKSILISQPKPEGKSPYSAIEKKHKLKIDYRPFMHVEEISAIEFKEQRISLLNHDAVIFTSKNAMDHYFGMMEKLRLRIPDFTKYFCVSEAIAHYLQNFITYRKRKIFTGEKIV